MTQKVRKIVHIDPDKCDGCGQCVPSCAEGAIQIVDGKAKLIAENLCDGLGNCLGECPRDAIWIEERPADEFDEAAVEARLAALREPAALDVPSGGCPGATARKLPAAAPADGSPGAMLRKFQGDASAAAGPATGGAVSRLTQWPVQLTLLPERGEIWHGADVLLSADCVAFAMGDFHERLLAGRTLAIACPKLDQADAYVAKLARIFADNDIASVTVAHMEVPCCFGLERIVQMAMEQAARSDIPVTMIEVAVTGEVLAGAAP